VTHRVPTKKLMNKQKTDDGTLLKSTDLFAELAEWVEYTEARTRELDKLAGENKPYPDAHARLETKAGCYRSLATEVKRILKANNQRCHGEAVDIRES